MSRRFTKTAIPSDRRRLTTRTSYQTLLMRMARYSPVYVRHRRIHRGPRARETKTLRSRDQVHLRKTNGRDGNPDGFRAADRGRAGHRIGGVHPHLVPVPDALVVRGHRDSQEASRASRCCSIRACRVAHRASPPCCVRGMRSDRGHRRAGQCRERTPCNRLGARITSRFQGPRSRPGSRGRLPGL